MRIVACAALLLIMVAAAPAAAARLPLLGELLARSCSQPSHRLRHCRGRRPGRHAEVVDVELNAPKPASPAGTLPLHAGLQLDICETYGHDACLEHADKCTPCLAW